MTPTCRTPNCTNTPPKRRRLCAKCHCRTYHPHTRRHIGTNPDQIRAVVEHRLPDHDLTNPDRRTATQQLTAAGLTAEQIADLIGVSARTIYRWRAKDRPTH